MRHDDISKQHGDETLITENILSIQRTSIFKGKGFQTSRLVVSMSCVNNDFPLLKLHYESFHNNFYANALSAIISRGWGFDDLHLY